MLDVETGEASPVRESEFVEGGATFSPDGNWIAYHSNESGEFHVYVIPWPDKGRRWQVSKQEAVYPSWTSNGDWIVFQHTIGQIMSAKVATGGGTFVVEELDVAFETATPQAGGAQWSVQADGSTFLTIPDSLSEADSGMKLTFGWPLELEGK